MSILMEEQIENRVERLTDNLDRLWLRGAITERQYNQSMKELHKWAEAKYRELENSRHEYA
jgi:hypothetical protein